MGKLSKTAAIPPSIFLVNKYKEKKVMKSKYVHINDSKNCSNSVSI